MMIPREHLPLTLVTVALIGLLFLLYRDVSALKTVVAQLSVPPTPVEEDLEEADDEDVDDSDDDVDDEPEVPAKKPAVPAVPAVPTVPAMPAMPARLQKTNGTDAVTVAAQSSGPPTPKTILNSSSTKDSALKPRK